ncbi:MAG: type II secretion system ATPase GspE [Candidatus Omnitrophica bacterium]|nr:type II secretion system ATPase GspE [Candidatus Omnitrophota bacterium]
MAKREKKSLGENLVEVGIITKEQYAEALKEEKLAGLRFRKAIVKMGYITDEDLVVFISNKLGIPRIELGNYLIDSKIIDLIPEELARKHELVPILKIGNRLTCAMVDPWNVFALDEARSVSGLIIEPAIATEEEIKQAITEYYSAKGSVKELLKAIDDNKVRQEAARGAGGETVSSEGTIIIKLVNSLIMNAIHEGASDIHIEPEEEILKTRYRVDGMLHEVTSPPKYLQSSVISRIKIMANLNIAETRVPQDGRFSIKMEGRDIDVRVSAVPTIYGENIVMRLLDVANTVLKLEELGFSKDMLQKFEKLIIRPHGILLVTGPTGSGKTTTLYASLSRINTVEKNIITIEDPVEYKLEGIRQIQVNPKVNLTFAGGLRSILRQDPDIIMVGEIRDLETVEIAVHAALTGHLVFSTLHTNDAAGAITRMIDMGSEPFLVASSVIGVLAQRLVRKICVECKEEYAPTQEALRDIGLDAKGQKTKIKFFRGKGCSKCMSTGYKGRIGIYELMVMNEDLRTMTIGKASSEEIRKKAVSQGMAVLKDDGIRKIREGITTVEEVLRVTQEE